MIQLSEGTALALHSMTYIAKKKNETISLKEIAGEFSVSEHHLSKILQRLVKAGYLFSVKGPKGGFQLKAGKENSTYMEIYEAIEGKHERKDCLFASKKGGCCSCIVSGLLDNLNDEFEKYMKEHKITK